MDFSNPWLLISGFVVSMIGLGLFINGKKMENVKNLGIGLVMMVFPDLERRRLRLLLDEFNCLFRVEPVGGARYVLRLTAIEGCHGVDETEAEIAWLNAILRETDLDARRPVAMRDGACSTSRRRSSSSARSRTGGWPSTR